MVIFNKNMFIIGLKRWILMRSNFYVSIMTKEDSREMRSEN